MKILNILFTLFGVITVIFFLFKVLPGDPARMMMDQNENEEQLTIIKKKYGFDKPVITQYLYYLNDLIIDPGFGFGKTLQHNFEILSNLHHFEIIDLPLLVGFSRKSMITKALEIEKEFALNGTSVLNTIALMKGAKILRVHDVKEAKECINLYNLTMNNSGNS